jgi:hypothetical protein
MQHYHSLTPQQSLTYNQWPKSLRMGLIEHLTENKNLKEIPTDIIKIIAEYTAPEYEKRLYCQFNNYNLCITNFKNIWQVKDGYLFCNAKQISHQKLDACYLYVYLDQYILLRNGHDVYVVNIKTHTYNIHPLGVLIMGMVIVDDIIIIQTPYNLSYYTIRNRQIKYLYYSDIEPAHLVLSHGNNILYSSITKEKNYIKYFNGDIANFPYRYVSTFAGALSNDEMIFKSCEFEDWKYITKYYKINMFTFKITLLTQDEIDCCVIHHCIPL